MALEILFPNGQVLGVQVYIDPGTGPIKWDGNVTASVTVGAVDQGNPGLLPWLMKGTLTHNNAAPTGNNLGVLTAIANAVAPTLNEGDQVLLSTDLAGALRVNATQGTSPWVISGTATVTGSVTANAGTDLNTSLLALESGGNLAALASIVSSARAAVNPIVGQAGLQGGSGVVTALTLRAVLATDVALPTGTNSIGQVTANAGTNLNTSALALESGGNLAAAAAVLGTTSGAAVITDANGTIQQYLRGLIKLAITAGSFLVTATLNASTTLIGYVGFKSTYAGKVTLTTTNFVSLTNTSGWQSVGISSAGARDIHFWFQTKSTGTGTSAVVDFYVATKLSNGTGYVDGATGTEGTFTAANRINSRYLGSLKMNNASEQAEFYLSDIFRGAIPNNVAIIGINNTGATISSTAGDTVFEYELVN